MTANLPSNADAVALVRAARGGLCGGCRYARLVRSSRESVFVRCTRPALPKYQGQPVLRCGYFEAALNELYPKASSEGVF